MRNKIKRTRILTTAGVCKKNAIQLKSYFQIMKNKLDDNWICEDDFVKSHVCFVRDDYLDKLSVSTKSKCDTLVIVNITKNSHLYNYKFQINMPITARKVEYILNKISKEVEYKNISHELNKNDKPISKLKSSIRSFFGHKNSIKIESLQSKREKVLMNLSEKINKKTASNNKILFLGSPGAGKSKLIETAKNISILNSPINKGLAIQKSVGIDYAKIQLKDKTKVSLLGVPDDIKLNFIWNLVERNISAIVIVLDMSRPELFKYLKFYLRMINAEISISIDVYCALTHSDKLNIDQDELKLKLNSEFPSIINSFILDCRVNQEVFLMLGSIYNCSIGTIQNKTH
jgi:signal recognition particle receptor subunit beta